MGHTFHYKTLVQYLHYLHPSTRTRLPTPYPANSTRFPHTHAGFSNRTFLAFVVFLSLLQCLAQRTLLVYSMRSKVKVRTCRLSTTASSSLPSVDDHSYPPQEDQGRPGKSNFSDGSEALFSMYLRRTKEEDSKMAESWKGYADGMLVFVSLHAPFHSSRIM